MLDVSSAINCEIGHAFDLMPTRQKRGGREVSRMYFPHKYYGLVDAAAVRVKVSNVPLVVGFKAMRTVSCCLSCALLSVAMQAVEDGNTSSCLRALVSHEVGKVAMLQRWHVWTIR